MRTAEEFMYWIIGQPGWEWTRWWWRLHCVIIKANGKTWEIKDPMHERLPQNVEALGCSGTGSRGLDWIGYDLDVGHGTEPYKTTEEAVEDARRFRLKLGGRAEIRLSKSGKGVHVRHMLPTPGDPKKAKEIALKLTENCWINLDATPMGRQAFWLWSVDPEENGFKLIEEHLWD